MKIRILATAVFAGLGFAATQAGAATIASADIAVIMDESGSMGGEQAFIGGAMQDLDAGLNAAGVTGNQFALVGYGANPPDPVGYDQNGRGNTNFMNSTDFNTATGGLRLNGGTEDGYDGIDFFFDNYTLRPGAATNVILVTDEDRDVRNAAVNKASIAQLLSDNNALLNVVVNAGFRCGDNSVALGIDSAGNGFQADGAGGFTTCTGGTNVSGFGTTETDYVDLALASGGAAWDLNQLRAGGDTATSFANAFINVKVEEIEEQTGGNGNVPAPAPVLLIGAGLLGLGMFRRRAA